MISSWVGGVRDQSLKVGRAGREHILQTGAHSCRKIEEAGRSWTGLEEMSLGARLQAVSSRRMKEHFFLQGESLMQLWEGVDSACRHQVALLEVPVCKTPVDDVGSATPDHLAVPFA